jgi:hypothetical protein
MIIIIIIIFSSFMQRIYTYIPETNRVPREHIVAAILSLLFMVPISPVPALALLYFYVSTFRDKPCLLFNKLYYYYYYYYYGTQLHFARCVIIMKDSTTTPTDKGRVPNFQYSGLVLECQILRHCRGRIGLSNSESGNLIW